jgi:hypothetical protein
MMLAIVLSLIPLLPFLSWRAQAEALTPAGRPNLAHLRQALATRAVAASRGWQIRPHRLVLGRSKAGNRPLLDRGGDEPGSEGVPMWEGFSALDLAVVGRHVGVGA